MTIDDQIGKLLDEHGAGEFLRAITRVAKGRWRSYTEEQYKRSLMKIGEQRAKENDLSYQVPRAEVVGANVAVSAATLRLAADLNYAWLILDVDHLADRFDDTVAHAGESDGERWERARRQRIEALKFELDWEEGRAL